MKCSVLLLLLTIFVGGCQTPLPQLSYRGTFKTNIANAFATADQFAAALAQEAHLEITDRSRPSGVARLDSTAYLQLRPDSSDRIWVNLSVHTSERELVMTIGGDFSSPEALDVARAAEKIFARLYPDASYAPFQAYQGLLGP